MHAQEDLTLSASTESKEPTVFRPEPFLYFVLWKLLLVASSREGLITRTAMVSTFSCDAAAESGSAHLNPAAWWPQHTPRMWETRFQFPSLERFQSCILTRRPEVILWQRCSHPSCYGFSAKQPPMRWFHTSPLDLLLGLEGGCTH